MEGRLAPLEGQVFAVTGGAGYFGSRLCAALLKRGAKEVRCFDWDLSRVPAGLLELAGVRLNLLQGDIRSPEDVQALTRGVAGVFHCASFGMSGKEMLRDSLIREVNVDGTLLLLDSCGHSKVKALVYTSTYNVIFGGLDIEDGDEDSIPYFPLASHVDAYARSKALAEQLVLHSNARSLSHGQDQLLTCALRPAAIYGPGETRHFPRIMRSVRCGLLRFRIGSPRARVDWVHVDNLVHAHLLAMAALLDPGTRHVPAPGQFPEPDPAEGKAGVEGEEGAVAPEPTPKPMHAAAGQAFFISDGAPMNNFDFLAPIVEAYGRAMPSLYVPVSLMLAVAWPTEWLYRLWLPLLGLSWVPQPIILPAEVYKVGVNHWFSIGKAQRQLGYEPVVSAEEGKRQMQLYWSAARGQEVPRPGAPGCLIILLGLLLLAIAAYTPRHKLPWLLQQVQSLGLLVFFSRQVLQTVFWGAVGIHVTEGVVAYFIALSVEPGNAVEWFIQTSLLGFWSLRLLLRRAYV